MLECITIVGCGLIGGSLAKALRARAARMRIFAIDREHVLARARQIVDGGAIPGSPESRELMARADLVVLATPVGDIVEAVAPALDAIREDAVVTDTGSVKRAVLAR